MKKTSLIFPLIGIVVAGAVYLIVQAGDAATEIAESMAAIEAARAAQDASEAAQIASRGLSTVSTIQSLILFVIVVAAIVLIGLVIYLVLERRTQNAQIATLLAASQKPRWAPGPNAGFRKLGETETPQLPSGDVTQQLMQLFLMQQLGHLVDGQQHPMLPPPQPAQETADDDDLWG
ncbi:MAG TPA: hypothetical protein PKM21_03465 [Anaerolineales bacterium]|nr:hypothetical protein [Anaerolineales bacterium]